jgi:hypothetical protein
VFITKKRAYCAWIPSRRPTEAQRRGPERNCLRCPGLRAATARSRSARALLRSRLRIRKGWVLNAFRAANGVPEFARIPARVSGSMQRRFPPRAVQLQPAAQPLAPAGLRPAPLAAPNPQGLGAQRIQSRERGAGIRQNSGQSKRFRPIPFPPRKSQLRPVATARSRGPAARSARGSESASARRSTHRFQAGPGFNPASGPHSARAGRQLRVAT